MQYIVGDLIMTNYLLLIAGEGPQYDYTVNSVRVRALANGQIDNVVVTFRVDTIAQENNETFTLTLTGLNLPVSPGPGFFVVDTLPVTIVDCDSKDSLCIVHSY